MSARKIYIARHGERLDFIDPSWYKTATLPHDPPLTSRGVEQATDLGRKLRECDIRHVFASPFSRCVNTASTAAAQISPDLQVCVEPGACEWLNRHWYAESEKGPVWRSLSSLKEEFSNVNDKYQPVFPMSYNFDGFPESMAGLVTRCEKMIRAVLETVQGEGNILVVGHGSSVEGLINVLLGISVEAVTYCCLTECIPTGEPFKYKVGLNCDTSFLSSPEGKEDTRYI